MKAYLLFCGGILNNVIHKHGKQFRNSIHATGIGSIGGRIIDLLALLLGMVDPSSGYGIYNVEYS